MVYGGRWWVGGGVEKVPGTTLNVSYVAFFVLVGLRGALGVVFRLRGQWGVSVIARCVLHVLSFARCLWAYRVPEGIEALVDARGYAHVRVRIS